MKQGFKNLARQAGVALTIALLVAQPAQATTLSKLVKMPAFMGLVVTIARLNQAMRSAAENPMDTHRRQAVQTAIAAMPAAISGLAMEFQAGRLHNGDLKTVQALLGGFIDVNAADNYKKFMVQPSATLIPKVGDGLPSSLLSVPAETAGNSSGSRLGFDDSRSKGANYKQTESSLGKDPYAQAPDLAPGANYYNRGVASAPEKIASSGSGASELRRTQGFSNEPTVGVLRDNSRSARSDIARDLASAEERAKAYRIQTAPQYWKFGTLLQHAQTVLVRPAHAGGDQENCGSCKGGGGAGGGGGGGGSGTDAATMLFGVAAIMSAVSPMITASMQANADKEMARTQAEAQKYMTDRTVQNSERLANISAQTSLQTASMQAQAAAANNQGVTERLSMQLASLEKAREDAAAQERERLALEQQYNERRIALAEKQAEQNVQLARATISAQLTQAGLSQGVESTNSGDALSSGGALGNNTFANSLASASTANSAGEGLSTGSMGLGIRASSSAETSPLSLSPMRAMAGASQAGALSKSAEFFEGQATSTSDKDRAQDTAASRLLASLRSGGRASSRALAGARSRVAASTTGLRAMVSSASKSSDISSFVQAASRGIASTSGDFAQYQSRNQEALRHQASSLTTARGMTAPSSEGHGAAAYNAP
jgi:trimeric autotransporter adhesin